VISVASWKASSRGNNDPLTKNQGNLVEQAMNEQEDSRNQKTPEESDVDGFEQREPSADEATEAVGVEEGQSTSCLSSVPLADPELDVYTSPPADTQPATAGDEASASPEGRSLDHAIERLASEASGQSEQLEAITHSLAGIEERLAALEKRPTASPRAVQQVEQRLQELSADGLVQSKRSLLKDVVALYDLAFSMGQTVDAREAMPVEEFRKRISMMAEQIAQLLQLNGLEPIQPDPGTPFDAKLHFARQGILCEEADMDRTIKAVHEMGFRSDAHVFRPAAVDVWVWKSSSETESAIAENSAVSDHESPDLAEAVTAAPEDAVNEPYTGDEPDQPVVSDDADSNDIEAPASSGGPPVQGQSAYPDDLVEDHKPPKPNEETGNQS